MENATKALLIAAGVMIAVMILSLLLIGYNQISDYYNKQHESTEVDQLTKFNSKFENYHRNKIRGSDMISLMNRVRDYNTTQHYQQGTGYERIIIKISIGTSNLDSFRYITQSNKTNYDFTYESILPNTGIITNESGSDDQLVSVTSKITNEINNNSSLGVSDTNLQTLTANISNIVLATNIENSSLEYDQRTREKRINLLKNTLKLSEDQINSNLEKIKKITCQYYEYTQFKRAYFDCTDVKYDEKTGRVCEMNFEVRTNGGNVEFN